ncbi:MAG: tRNA pseudouridine(38-40) synthase TruA [Balneolaceae bacterium]|nr:tRNA pseudouridine(38-40) synthase TruA [Balneolaceae bacterium]
MPRYKLTIEYDGTDFSGWQIQPDALTVEQVLEDAFSRKLQQEIDLAGQGRTDAGVHASGQVAHVDFPKNIDLDTLLNGVNKMIGRQVQVVACEEVSDNFHARFDGIAREYEYTFVNRSMPLRERYSWQYHRPVDVEKMQVCAGLLRGEHDFSGFSKYNEDNLTTLCTVSESYWEQNDEVMIYHVKANRFLRNMVRRLVGTMVWVGEGKISKEDFERGLKYPSSNIATYTAPACGLVLKKVFYKK